MGLRRQEISNAGHQRFGTMTRQPFVNLFSGNMDRQIGIGLEGGT